MASRLLMVSSLPATSILATVSSTVSSVLARSRSVRSMGGSVMRAVIARECSRTSCRNEVSRRAA
jgi:hypothetical protein